LAGSAATHEAAQQVVRQFTAAAALIGAVPVPAASAAIVAENAAMVACVARELGVPVSLQTVAQSLRMLASVNLVGRALFVDIARLFGWAAGPLGLAGLSALGASTAGLQTWIVGQLAIAIGQNGGAVLSSEAASQVVAAARSSYGPPESGTGPGRPGE
jgi:hypothetical protein